eukprot:m.50485 g.50485  ORF g.50485 m.50485 type:complete len:321 (-) comp12550_c1_seq2:99-1061(-)
MEMSTLHAYMRKKDNAKVLPSTSSLRLLTIAHGGALLVALLLSFSIQSLSALDVPSPLPSQEGGNNEEVMAAASLSTSTASARLGEQGVGAVESTVLKTRHPMVSDKDEVHLNVPLREVEMPDEKLIESYRKHFAIKRAEQVKAAELIFEKPQYDKRFNLVRPLLDELFKTLRTAQRTLQDVDLKALRPIPANEPAILQALLHVWENIAFFGDLILRLPDQVHTLFDGHAVRTELIRWGVDLCLSSPVYEDVHKEQLQLVLQETKLATELDPNYVNPFSEAYIREQQLLKREEQRKQEEYMRKVIKRQQLKQRKLQRTEL